METEVPPTPLVWGKEWVGMRQEGGYQLPTERWRETVVSGHLWTPLSFLDMGYPTRFLLCKVWPSLPVVIHHFKLESFRGKNSKGENYLPGLI